MGASFCALAWYWLPGGDRSAAFLGAAGAMLLSWGLALTALPARVLGAPTEANERVVDNAQEIGWTVLGRVLQCLSFLVGVGAYVCLRTGL